MPNGEVSSKIFLSLLTPFYFDENFKTFPEFSFFSFLTGETPSVRSFLAVPILSWDIFFPVPSFLRFLVQQIVLCHLLVSCHNLKLKSFDLSHIRFSVLLFHNKMLRHMHFILLNNCQWNRSMNINIQSICSLVKKILSSNFVLIWQWVLIHWKLFS